MRMAVTQSPHRENLVGRVVCMTSFNRLIPTSKVLIVLGVSRSTFDRWANKAEESADFKGDGKTSGQFWMPDTVQRIADAGGGRADWTAL